MRAIDDRRPAPPPPGDFNLADYVFEANGASDDRVALAILSPAGAERWSYGKLRYAVRRASGALLEAGGRPGMRCLLRLGHSPLFPVAFLGAVRAGLLPVPLPATANEGEAGALADAASPDIVVADPALPLPDLALPLIAPDRLLAGAPLGRAESGAPDRPAYVLFTSGTARRPAAVVHAHRAVWARRLLRLGWDGMTAEDRVLHAGAFNWSFTLGTGLLDPWSLGATALVLAPGVAREQIPLLARRHEATILAGVPGVFRAVTSSLPKLRHGLSAGEKLPETLRAAWREATGGDIHEAYGQTECSTFVSGSPAQPAPPGTVGRVQPGRAVAILAEDGTPVPRGEAGEIAVSADDPGLCLGRPAGAGGDWVVTGDLGRMRDDGTIEHLGRADDVLTAGGFRLSPAEIEAAFEGLSVVTALAAADHRTVDGTTLVALHYEAAAPIPDESFRVLAERDLAPHKRPRLYVHHAELPRSANGKVLRRRLRAATGGS